MSTSADAPPVRPARVSEPVYSALGYLVARLQFLGSRWAPQVHWGDIALALDGFPEDALDLSSAAFWDEWRWRWVARAESWSGVADRSTTTAGRSRALRSAAACYHWAEFMYFDDAKQKLLLRQRIRDCFLRSIEDTDLELTAHDLQAVPGVRAAVPYWVVLPPAGRRPAGPLPAVVLSNGLDSMTEVEVLALAEAYLERGIAAVLFDGPGQGIQVGQTPLLVEMETVVADLVEQLRADPRIAGDRLAFLGISFGGYLALRVARALGGSFRCVVNFGGGPRLTPFAALRRRLKDDVCFAFGVDPADADALVGGLALDPGPPPLTDVLSVHGALDDIFPLAPLTELGRAWGDRHRLEVYEREAHTCLNPLNEYTLRTADWVDGQLRTTTSSSG